MLHRNAFNIVDYSLRETAKGLVLRPGFKHLFFHILAGTGLCAMLATGALGLDHELRQMREARRLTSQDLARMDQGVQVQVDQFITLNQPEKAAQIKQDAEAMKASLVQEREAEMARLEARDRPWHMLLLGVAAIAVFFGMLIPLSFFWQRVRIAREGDLLVVRNRGLIPRTRRIPVAAAEAPTIDAVRAMTFRGGQSATASLLWRVLLTHQDLTLYLWAARSRFDQTTPPERATRLVSCIQALPNPLRVA